MQAAGCRWRVVAFNFLVDHDIYHEQPIAVRQISYEKQVFHMQNLVVLMSNRTTSSSSIHRLVRIVSMPSFRQVLEYVYIVRHWGCSKELHLPLQRKTIARPIPAGRPKSTRSRTQNDPYVPSMWSSIHQQHSRFGAFGSASPCET